MLRLDQLAPTMGVESWIIMASGAFLLSLCFLVSFIAADAGRRRPTPGFAATTSGRIRSAPSGKIYTRDEIKRLYELHRTGQWQGSEAEWARQENDLYRAQREGRVAGGLDLLRKVK